MVKVPPTTRTWQLQLLTCSVSTAITISLQFSREPERLETVLDLDYLQIPVRGVGESSPAPAGITPVRIIIFSRQAERVLLKCCMSPHVGNSYTTPVCHNTLQPSIDLLKK